MSVFIVGFGGFLGAVARYLINHFIRSQTSIQFPVATLMINVVGCFFIGVLMVFVERAVPYHRHILLLGVTGILGSFTTFSAFGFETLHLLRSGDFYLASINVMANVLLGLVAVWIGRLMVQ